jgi:hypothetical protein
LLFEQFTQDDLEHIEENTLESYAMGNVRGEQADEVERHLLICDTCRSKLNQADAFSRSMKKAAPMLPAEHERSRWMWRILMPVCAACALLLILVALKFSPFTGNRSPVEVALYSMRGPASEAHAPADRPLLLRPDLGGLTPASRYDLEVVDSNGARVWSGTAITEGESATVATPGLRRGVYFVRISLEGELLREYSLTLDPGR